MRWLWVKMYHSITRLLPWCGNMLFQVWYIVNQEKANCIFQFVNNKLVLETVDRNQYTKYLLHSSISYPNWKQLSHLTLIYPSISFIIISIFVSVFTKGSCSNLGSQSSWVMFCKHLPYALHEEMCLFTNTSQTKQSNLCVNRRGPANGDSVLLKDTSAESSIAVSLTANYLYWIAGRFSYWTKHCRDKDWCPKYDTVCPLQCWSGSCRVTSYNMWLETEWRQADFSCVTAQQLWRAFFLPFL